MSTPPLGPSSPGPTPPPVTAADAGLARSGNPAGSPAGPPAGGGPGRGGPAHSPRSGAHRPRRPLWQDLAPVLVVLVAVAALVIGVFALKDSVLGSSSTSSSSTPDVQDPQAPAPTAPTSTSPSKTPSPTSTTTGSAAPTVNKNVHVHVWNGTGRSGLAAGAAQKLSGKGWNAASAGNQSGYGAVTTVYYPRATLRATAQAVAKALGGYRVKQSTAYGSSGVIVVLGSDYQG